MVIVTIISSVIILTGVVIGALTLNGVGEDGTTNITFSEDVHEGTAEFREMLVHPGETLEHTLLLKNKVEGECRLKIDFDEHKPNLLANELKKYVYVTVTLSGEPIVENILLEEMFSTEIPVITCNLSKKEPVELKILFHMPVETGNEAEFTEAYFDVHVSISNE